MRLKNSALSAPHLTPAPLLPKEERGFKKKHKLPLRWYLRVEKSCPHHDNCDRLPQCHSIMTFDISKYPEPEDYGEVLLRLIASPHRRPAPVFPGTENLPGPKEGDELILVGETKGDLSNSLFEREWLGIEEKPLSEPSESGPLVQERHAEFVKTLLKKNLINAAYLVSDGGIACAAAELALASEYGVSFESGNDFYSRFQLGGPSDEIGYYHPYKGLIAGMFSEEPGRLLLAMHADDWEQMSAETTAPMDISVSQIGLCLRDSFDIVLGDDALQTPLEAVSREDLRKAQDQWRSQHSA